MEIFEFEAAKDHFRLFECASIKGRQICLCKGAKDPGPKDRPGINKESKRDFVIRMICCEYIKRGRICNNNYYCVHADTGCAGLRAEIDNFAFKSFYFVL